MGKEPVVDRRADRGLRHERGVRLHDRAVDRLRLGAGLGGHARDGGLGHLVRDAARRDRRRRPALRPGDAEAEGMNATTAADPRTATILDAIGETPLDPHRRHLGQARVPQPVRLGEGADRPLHDRARRARGAPPPRRHHRRGLEREHRQRDEHGRGGEGLPDARGHARGDEPGAAGHQPGVRRGGPDHRRLPRDAGAREGARAREPAGPLQPAAVRFASGTSTRTASGSGRSCSASSRTASCPMPSSRGWAPAGR